LFKKSTREQRAAYKVAAQQLVRESQGEEINGRYGEASTLFRILELWEDPKNDSIDSFQIEMVTSYMKNPKRTVQKIKINKLYVMIPLSTKTSFAGYAELYTKSLLRKARLYPIPDIPFDQPINFITKFGLSYHGKDSNMSLVKITEAIFRYIPIVTPKQDIASRFLNDWVNFNSLFEKGQVSFKGNTTILSNKRDDVEYGVLLESILDMPRIGSGFSDLSVDADSSTQIIKPTHRKPNFLPIKHPKPNFQPIYHEKKNGSGFYADNYGMIQGGKLSDIGKTFNPSSMEKLSQGTLIDGYNSYLYKFIL